MTTKEFSLRTKSQHNALCASDMATLLQKIAVMGLCEPTNSRLESIMWSDLVRQADKCVMLSRRLMATEDLQQDPPTADVK